MAEIEKTEAKAVENKAEKKPEKSKKPSLGSRIAKFFRDYKSELGKVTWASKEDTVKNTVVVAVSVIAVGAVVCVLDWAFGLGIQTLGNVIVP